MPHQLPFELWEQVLVNLDAITIARCSLTCKQLRDIIQYSTHIQYQVALYFSHLVPRSSPGCAPRKALSETLAEHREAWITSALLEIYALPLRTSGGETDPLAGQIGSRPTVLSLNKLRADSTSSGIDRDAKAITLDYTTMALAVDVEQDLLVTVEPINSRILSSRQAAANIRFRRLSTTAKHPFAHEDCIQIDWPYRTSRGAQIEIHGDWVAFLPRRTPAMHDTDLMIWNWKKGTDNKGTSQTTADITTMKTIVGPVSSIKFLSDEIVLATMATSSGSPRLVMIDLAAKKNARAKLGHHAAVILCLPAMLQRLTSPPVLTITTNSIDCASEPGAKNVVFQRAMPFHAGMCDELIAVKVDTQESGICSAGIAIPRSRLLALYQSQHRKSFYDWQDWSHHAAAFPLDTRARFAVRGMQLVLSNDDAVCKLYDFWRPRISRLRVVQAMKPDSDRLWKVADVLSAVSPRGIGDGVAGEPVKQKLTTFPEIIDLRQQTIIRQIYGNCTLPCHATAIHETFG